jgi:diguanylate cyclase (GGDEF)-like protein/PAS domain S-box-containing protein
MSTNTPGDSAPPIESDSAFVLPFGIDDEAGGGDLSSLRALVASLDKTKAIAQFSLDGILLSANDQFLAMLGYRRSDALGAHHRRFCDDTFVESPAYDHFWQRLGAGEAYTDLCMRRRRDRTACWLEATYAPVYVDGRITRILKIASDVTERVAREALAQQSVKRLSLVADATDNAVFITDAHWRAVFVNAGFERKFGWRGEEVMGRVPMDVLAPNLDEAKALQLGQELRNGRDVRWEEVLQGRGQERYWCSVATSPVFESGRLVNTVTVITDITQSKVHEVLHRRVLEAIVHDEPLLSVLTTICAEVDRMLPDLASAVVEAAPDGTLHLLVAPRLPADALRHHSGKIRWPADDIALVDPLARFTFDALPEHPLRKDLRRLGYDCVMGLPVRDADGRLIGGVVLHCREGHVVDSFQRELMEAAVHLCSLALTRERAKQQIRQLAFYDALTKLPNRSLLLAKADQALATAKRNDAPVAVVFIDLDRFKHVNDSLGHAAGDELLRHVADRIGRARRQADIAGRLSGDEFVLILPDCDARHATDLVERLQGQLSAPVDLGASRVQCSASMGVAMFPHDGVDIATLLQRADMAMYQAKSQMPGRFAFFSHELNVQAQERLAMEDALRLALLRPDSHGLSMAFQPQLSLKTGALHGVEALARWHHPQFGHVSPARFVPLAEDCGLIRELSHWALECACHQLAQWRAAGLDVPSVSVNLSATNFQDLNLPDVITATLACHGLGVADLIVEITEGVLVNDHPVATASIAALHAQGIRFSMDDFGTGYSSLSYLRRLPISELKLDRSFTNDLADDPRAQALSRSVAQIGAALGLTVVAEGIETDEQRAVLTSQGYDVAQGYLFARPLAPDAFEAWYRGVVAPRPETVA